MLCKTGNKNDEYILQGVYDLCAITFYLTIFFTNIIVLIGIYKIEPFLKINKCIIQADLAQDCYKLNTCKHMFLDKRVSYDIIIFLSRIFM